MEKNIKIDDVMIISARIMNKATGLYDYFVCTKLDKEEKITIYTNPTFSSEEAVDKYISENCSQIAKKAKASAKKRQGTTNKKTINSSPKSIDNKENSTGTALAPRNINNQIIELPNYVIVDPTPISVIDEEDSKNNSSKDEYWRVVFTALGLTALLGATAYVLGNSKYDGCTACGIKKATSDSINKSSIETEAPTAEPTEVELATEVPTPTPDSLTVAVIEDMAKDILTDYQNTNKNINDSIDIIEDGQLVNFQLEESDIKNAITILNVDELSQEHYPTFQELIKGKEVDGFYGRNENFMASAMMKNIQSYYQDKNTDNFIWFSPLLLNEDDKAEIAKIEGIIIETLKANLGYDAILQNSNSSEKATVQELIKSFINEVDLNIVNSKNSNGIYHIVAFYCDLLENTCQNTISEMQLASLQDIEDRFEDKAYIGTMNILNTANTNNYGCYLEEDKYIRTRHM